MIVTNPSDEQLAVLDEVGSMEPVTVFTPSDERVSELLGPDGEPLRVAYERPALGFDLRPANERAGR